MEPVIVYQASYVTLDFWYFMGHKIAILILLASIIGLLIWIMRLKRATRRVSWLNGRLG